MRVLYVIPSMGFGGAEALLASQIPFLVSEGVEPIIVTVTSERSLLDAHGVEVKHISLGLSSAAGPVSGFVSALRIAKRLRRVIRDQRPDIVHLNLYRGNWFGLLASRGLGPVFVTLHNVDGWMASPSLANTIRRWLQRLVTHRQTTHFIAVSESVKSWHCKFLPLAEDRVEVIYNGVDLSTFVKETPSRDSAPPRIVMVGRFYHQKAHDVAVAALGTLASQGTDFVADFFGKGPLLESTRQLIVENNLGACIRCRGICTTIAQTLPDYDLFMMPSRFEGLGIAAIEAMASFVPVVATRVSGLSEVVDHERTGLLVPPDDPGALAEAIHRVLQDPALRERLALAGRRKVEQQFDLRLQVGKLADLYREFVPGNEEREIGGSKKVRSRSSV